MTKVVGINFSSKGRVYYFKNNDLNLKKEMPVLVETDQGLQLGFVNQEERDIDEDKVVTPLKDVLKIASNSDLKIYENNLKDSQDALEKAKKIVEEYNLNMHILDASFTFDKKQLLFNFTADERVDFRELAKKLASIYKTRIELHQIGIRDKARVIGGLGPCGRFLCCNQFLNDINSVTINMAKNQMLALNPTKINGVCGRLLCCLGYEDEVYTELKRGLPNIGDDYKYKDTLYKVKDIDIYKRKVILETEEHIQEEVYL